MLSNNVSWLRRFEQVKSRLAEAFSAADSSDGDGQVLARADRFIDFVQQIDPEVDEWKAKVRPVETSNKLLDSSYVCYQKSVTLECENMWSAWTLHALARARACNWREHAPSATLASV